MALGNCKECGKAVSEDAKACPACGNPIRVGALRTTRWGCGLLILFGLIVIFFK